MLLAPCLPGSAALGKPPASSSHLSHGGGSAWPLGTAWGALAAVKGSEDDDCRWSQSFKHFYHVVFDNQKHP